MVWSIATHTLWVLAAVLHARVGPNSLAPFEALQERDDTPQCACFSFCHPEEIQEFFVRLPVVTSRSSPWVPYLRAVYDGDELRYPVDLFREFGAFLIPTELQRARIRLPLSLLCDNATKRSALPMCSRSTCARWLDFSHERNEMLARMVDGMVTKPLLRDPITYTTWHIAGREVKGRDLWTSWLNQRFPNHGAVRQATMPISPDSTIRVHVSRSFGLRAGMADPEPVFIQRYLQTNRDRHLFAPNDTWVEASRITVKWPEGLAYGCWFSPLIPPYSRGTGLWVNTGRTIAFYSRDDTQTWCTREFANAYLEAHRHEFKAPPSAVLEKGPEGDLRGRKRFNPPDMTDSHLPVCGLAKGYDTVQIQLGVGEGPEIIVTRPVCTIPGSGQRLGVCPPKDLPLREGWGATRPCKCLREARIARGMGTPTLRRANCFGLRPSEARQRPASDALDPGANVDQNRTQAALLTFETGTEAQLNRLWTERKCKLATCRRRSNVRPPG
mmetsp:Transcript_22571/g.70683  ORF Transcript_22571/g.70683 Transcript_22571/m.70683 type:complete len:499 (+) Transcript_22571:60-1556(+)